MEKSKFLIHCLSDTVLGSGLSTFLNTHLLHVDVPVLSLDLFESVFFLRLCHHSLVDLEVAEFDCVVAYAHTDIPSTSDLVIHR